MAAPPRRDRPSLAERSRMAGVGTGAEPGPAARTDDARRRGQPTHCWVVPDAAGLDRSPGLVLAWRREAAGWSALVVFVVLYGDDGDGPTALVQTWLPATRLQTLSVERPI